MNKKVFVILGLKQYKRYISPVLGHLGADCIYDESCSTYAMSCFQKYPFPKALFLSMKRVASCNPVNARMKQKRLKVFGDME